MYFHNYSPIYSPLGHGLAFAFLPLIIAAAVWTILLKGFALWYAARAEQKWWFIALLIINTLGILEIIYLIWFRPANPHYDHPHQDHHAHHDTPAHSSSAQA
jgi:hypothetical protein